MVTSARDDHASRRSALARRPALRRDHVPAGVSADATSRHAAALERRRPEPVHVVARLGHPRVHASALLDLRRQHLLPAAPHARVRREPHRQRLLRGASPLADRQPRAGDEPRDPALVRAVRPRRVRARADARPRRRRGRAERHRLRVFAAALLPHRADPPDDDPVAAVLPGVPARVPGRGAAARSASRGRILHAAGADQRPWRRAAGARRGDRHRVAAGHRHTDRAGAAPPRFRDRGRAAARAHAADHDPVPPGPDRAGVQPRRRRIRHDVVQFPGVAVAFPPGRAVGTLGRPPRRRGERLSVSRISSAAARGGGARALARRPADWPVHATDDRLDGRGDCIGDPRRGGHGHRRVGDGGRRRCACDRERRSSSRCGVRGAPGRSAPPRCSSDW